MLCCGIYTQPWQVVFTVAGSEINLCTTRDIVISGSFLQSLAPTVVLDLSLPDLCLCRAPVAPAIPKVTTDMLLAPVAVQLCFLVHM